MASISDLQQDAGSFAAITPARLACLQHEDARGHDLATSLPRYVSGTRIRTVDGLVAVEHLRIGDSLVTASGARRPVRRLAHRTLAVRGGEQTAKAPVRIARDAFDVGKPKRDLLVSPGQSICVDLLGEVLIPAAALINGSTIRRQEVDAVTYWHVELDSHDIILAEDLTAESHLAAGNRGIFAQSGVVEIGASPDATRRGDACCRPFHTGGTLVEAVRFQLAVRAERLGWRVREQGLNDLHLEADGRRVEPLLQGLTARFTLPAGVRDVWLVSHGGRSPGSERHRGHRGVCVAALAVNNGFGETLHVPAEDARLVDGFHEVERHGGHRAVRWTSGRARLPAELWSGLGETFYLRVDLLASALPRSVAPRGIHDGGTPTAL